MGGSGDPECTGRWWCRSITTCVCPDYGCPDSHANHLPDLVPNQRPDDLCSDPGTDALTNSGAHDTAHVGAHCTRANSGAYCSRSDFSCPLTVPHGSTWGYPGRNIRLRYQLT